MPKFKIGDELELNPDQTSWGYLASSKRVITAVGDHSYLYLVDDETEYSETFERLERAFKKKEPFWEVGKTYTYGGGLIFFEPQYLEQDSNGDRVAIGRERMGAGGKTYWTLRRQFVGLWTTE